MPPVPGIRKLGKRGQTQSHGLGATSMLGMWVRWKDKREREREGSGRGAERSGALGWEFLSAGTAVAGGMSWMQTVTPHLETCCEFKCWLHCPGRNCL